MALSELTPQLVNLEEAVTILFCQVDDSYYRLKPKGRHYETLKELTDSEVIILALFQQPPPDGRSRRDPLTVVRSLVDADVLCAKRCLLLAGVGAPAFPNCLWGRYTA